MIQGFVGYSMIIMGVIGLLFNKNIDYLLQMMENSAAIMSVLACFIGMLAITLTPIREQKIHKKIEVETIEDEDLIAPDRVHEIQREHPKKYPGPKESRIKLGRNIPKNSKGIILDT